MTTFNSNSRARHKVATLAVGTEITDGQILDRNSQWLSERVIEFGCEVVEHRAVPDDRPIVVRALTELSSTSDILFVTGGLGPTSDDFTRDCVAEVLGGQPLIWSDEAWAWVEERLKSRGAAITENQRQQCFFPEGATLLRNNHGTAFGFYFQIPQATGKLPRLLVCLPGPPPEIESIWQAGLGRVVKDFNAFSANKSRELSIIRTMGIGEGALAHTVEEILSAAAGRFNLPRLEVGYRAHVPYVEVKIWSEPDQRAMATSVIEEICQKYSANYVNRDREDVADGFLDLILAHPQKKVLICDLVTEGELYRRLLEKIRSKKDDSLLGSFSQNVIYLATSDRDLLAKLDIKASIFSLERDERDENNRDLVLRQDDRVQRLPVPKLVGKLDAERGRKWATEVSMKYWGIKK